MSLMIKYFLFFIAFSMSVCGEEGKLEKRYEKFASEIISSISSGNFEKFMRITGVDPDVSNIKNIRTRKHQFILDYYFIRGQIPVEVWNTVNVFKVTAFTDPQTGNKFLRIVYSYGSNFTAHFALTTGDVVEMDSEFKITTRFRSTYEVVDSSGKAD